MQTDPWPWQVTPPPHRDLYQERIDRGECAWCNEQATWTVSFDGCDHAWPCCGACRQEYFLGVGWEWMWPPEEFDPTCPGC